MCLTSKIKTRRPVLCGIGDDTAVIEHTKGTVLLFTTDIMVEGVHFTRDIGGYSIGYKALATNISDIAAMGGIPTYAVVSLGIPKTETVEFARALYRGIAKIANRFKVQIVGGDTVRSKDITINIALLGTASKKKVILRSGAKICDKIFITGPLGRSFKTGKHYSFVPRVDEAQDVLKKAPLSSMIDISDGLAGDLNHICVASNVGAILYSDAIPRVTNATLSEALYDGEDYELLFSVPRRYCKKLDLLIQKKKIFCIGEIVNKKKGYSLVDGTGNSRKINPKKAFTHF